MTPDLTVYGARRYEQVRGIPFETKREKHLELLLQIEKCCVLKKHLWCNSCIEKIFYSRWLTASCFEDQGIGKVVALAYRKRAHPLLVPTKDISQQDYEDVKYFNSCTLYIVQCLKESLGTWSKGTCLGRTT